MKILVVEDDLLMRKLILEILSGSHIVADAAPNLRISRDLLNENSYDVVVLELCLPDGSGIDLMSECKLLEGYPSRFIVISDFSHFHEKIELCSSMQVSSIFFKPFDCEELRKEALSSGVNHKLLVYPHICAEDKKA